MAMGQCWLSVRLFFGGQHSRRDVGYRTLSDNGSVLAFCEAVFWRSAFATRCWFTAFSVVIGRSAFATPCWFTAFSVVMGECWLSVSLFLTVSIRDAMWVPERIGLRAGAGAADLIGSCASGHLGRPLGGPGGPRIPETSLKGPKMSILSVFWL